ncbi:MAG: glutaminase [Terrimicrobiaceae bacterium]|nr:glutaminase [Terrimicrobiaceae bacterium]
MSRDKIEDLRVEPRDEAPLASPIQAVIDDLHRQIAKEHSGNVATYIPELGRANPDWFGVCVVTADGKIYEAGDTQQEFTVQSISKPFVYGRASRTAGARRCSRRSGWSHRAPSR